MTSFSFHFPLSGPFFSCRCRDSVRPVKCTLQSPMFTGSWRYPPVYKNNKIHTSTPTPSYSCVGSHGICAHVHVRSGTRKDVCRGAARLQWLRFTVGGGWQGRGGSRGSRMSAPWWHLRVHTLSSRWSSFGSALNLEGEDCCFGSFPTWSWIREVKAFT